MFTILTVQETSEHTYQAKMVPIMQPNEKVQSFERGCFLPVHYEYFHVLLGTPFLWDMFSSWT